MNIARLTVGDRHFFIEPEQVEDVLSAVSAARKQGDWMRVTEAGGRQLRMLIPSQALIVLYEYETDDSGPPSNAGDWASLDFDF